MSDKIPYSQLIREKYNLVLNTKHSKELKEANTLDDLKSYINYNANRGNVEFSVHFPNMMNEKTRECAKVHSWKTYSLEHKALIIKFLTEEGFKFRAWYEHVTISLL